MLGCILVLENVELLLLYCGELLVVCYVVVCEVLVVVGLIGWEYYVLVVLFGG